jgi:NADPH-dependent curcumin reductase CurA
MMVMHPTAWHLLIDRGALEPGETVLILAAGGALGTAGIQVAKLAGARVIAAAGADWKQNAQGGPRCARCQYVVFVHVT